MGKASRDKGARGEREAIKVLARYGITAVRTAPMQAAHAEQYGDIAIKAGNTFAQFVRIEVKRMERPNPDGALTECRSHGAPENIVLYRRNASEWRVCLSLDDLFTLLRGDDYKQWRNEP